MTGESVTSKHAQRSWLVLLLAICGLAVMMHLATAVRPKVQTVFSFVVCEDGSAPNKQNGTKTLLERWGGRWAVTVESSVRQGRLTLGLGSQGHALACRSCGAAHGHPDQEASPPPASITAGHQAAPHRGTPETRPPHR